MREREGGRERVYVCERGREVEKECVCERGREVEYVCERGREVEKECMCVREGGR